MWSRLWVDGSAGAQVRAISGSRENMEKQHLWVDGSSLLLYSKTVFLFVPLTNALIWMEVESPLTRGEWIYRFPLDHDVSSEWQH